MSFRAVVLRAAGTNCDGETVAALRAAGADAELLHVNRLIASPAALRGADLLVFPGGFTFGDDVASGAVLAFTIEKRLRRELESFVGHGRLVLGVCNGFQVLVRLGLLPGGGARAALAPNLSQRFIGRWVRLRSGANAGTWFRPNTEYELPVAHGEGRFEWYPPAGQAGAQPPEKQIALRYIADPGAAPYAWNPNGSFADVAGITNPDGNVLGLMPHPERFARPCHYPSWMRYRQSDGATPREEDLPVPLGLDLFRRVVASRS